MIQFNLLPDVKKEYIKAKRTKQLIVTVSTIVSVASIAIVLLLVSFVHGVQKGHIDDLTSDITSEIDSLKSIADLDKTLTVQNQLNSLSGLHEEKPEASRLFGYLNQITPVLVKIRSVSMNFEAGTMSIAGSADSLATINQYSDTLKFAKYSITVPETDEIIEGKPFTNVATTLSRSEDQASYEVSFNFDPLLFDNTLDIALVIDEQITTRSITGKPSTETPLFENNPDAEGQ